jgi:hypothetical protein
MATSTDILIDATVWGRALQSGGRYDAIDLAPLAPPRPSPSDAVDGTRMNATKCGYVLTAIGATGSSSRAWRTPTAYRHCLGKFSSVVRMESKQRAFESARGMKSGGPLPKVRPLTGSLHAEWKTCGKPNCRCVHGDLHGPYYFRHWREHGRQRKVYVPRDQCAEVKQAIEEANAARALTWATRQALAELHRMEKEILGCRTR